MIEWLTLQVFDCHVGKQDVRIARKREVTSAVSLEGIFRNLENYFTIRMQHFANDVLQVA